jgi:hypothetical protein
MWHLSKSFSHKTLYESAFLSKVRLNLYSFTTLTILEDLYIPQPSTAGIYFILHTSDEVNSGRHIIPPKQVQGHAYHKCLNHQVTYPLLKHKIQSYPLFLLIAPTLGSLLPLLEHRAEFPQFLDQEQSVGLLGRVISSSQGLYLYTNTKKRTHIHKH